MRGLRLASSALMLVALGCGARTGLESHDDGRALGVLTAGAPPKAEAPPAAVNDGASSVNPVATSTPAAVIPPQHTPAPDREMPAPEPAPWWCGDRIVSEREQCDDGNRDTRDGCSPGCRLEVDWVCDGECVSLVSCGDGILSRSELCEPSAGARGCTNQCEIEHGWKCPTGTVCEPICGDGEVVGDEQCDDGNALLNDGCSDRCLIEAAPLVANPDAGIDGASVCGDGIVAADEHCDDGAANQLGYGHCAPDCQSRPRCGDGVIQDEELCDDGFNDELYATDTGCAPGCVLPGFCGDGLIEHGEECDLTHEFNQDAYGTCSPSCRLASHCGDGTKEQDFEECDDGNHENSDGCEFDCRNSPQR